MNIKLPHVKKFDRSPNGIIIKVVDKEQLFDSTVSKFKKGKAEGYLTRFKGEDLLILEKSATNSIKNEYRRILYSDKDLVIEQNKELDLTNLKWIKHPLLTEEYLIKHNKVYVSNSWNDAFTYKIDKPYDPGLRIPQIGALHALAAHWCISDETANIVLPTGTGKTETMLSCLICNNISSLLVIVPTDALRDQLALKFSTLGVLPKFGVVNEECENPIVGLIEHGFKTKGEVDTFFDQINVGIATMSVVSLASSEIQFEIAQKISHLFIDEAHHTPASTWSTFKSQFSEKKIVQFTATPFRNDGKKLDGKFVFNFPLKKAQELEYFTPIHFKPISQHDRKLADEEIAELAIKTLAEDLNMGYDHILMVRVNKISRAEEILPFYAKYPIYNPVIVHSQIKPHSKLKALIRDIVAMKHRIILCVDMLGEGFDLPELKIAAFHDTKKSLAITLQLAGRFTRSKASLGPATFIANLAEAEVTEDLEDLYLKDSDWNKLLPDLSFKMSLEQEDFRGFLEGFKGFPDKFPIQAIKHPLSTIIFKHDSDTWTPLKYKKGIPSIDSYQYVYSDYNEEQEVLILILGKKSFVKWAKIEDFTSVEWDIVICHFDKKSKLLFLHASNTGSYFERFVQSIAKDALLIKEQNIFRCFSGLNRLRLHNVGVRVPMGRAMNYIMRVGSDIKTSLKQTEINQAIKSNIFGVGFENGTRNSIGCSHNGRIWSMRTNNIPTWIKWCKAVAKKITDENINADDVLKGTLLPKEITILPDTLAFSIEWPDYVYRELIGYGNIIFKNEEYPLWNCDLSLISQTNKTIVFQLELPSGNHKITYQLLNENGSDYAFQCSNELFIDANKTSPLSDYLYRNPPMVYFVDGSFLEGNLYTEITHLVPQFTIDKIQALNWAGINIRKESQTYLKHTESIQYSIIQKIKGESKYSIIMDDDDKGEVGDIVAFNVNEVNHELDIDIFHCKYTNENTAGTRIKDFYEVCSQAQKSIKWMENTDEIFKHLSKRSQQRFKKHQVDRFEIGDEEKLDILRRRAKKDLKVKMNIFIVQPGLSKNQYSVDSDISRLLAVVESYLKETWNAKLFVYVNI